MARSRTDQTTHTQLAAQHGPKGHTQYDGDGARSAVAGVTSIVLGGIGIMAGIVPRLGVIAIVLAAVTLMIALPAIRTGRDAPGHRYARVGAALGVVALLLGAVNIAIQLELFNDFTTR